jgi:N-methylhydantoinase A/oxoprolinase/acetone carboxylase beta subunit
VTDANLFLGRLGENPEMAGGIELDLNSAVEAISSLADELGIDAGTCAAGILQVADTEMIRALRVMTVERGLDPADFALLAFGGAGPLHAASIADELGIDRVLVPTDGGVFSALGLAAAEHRRDEIRTVLMPEPEITTARLRELIGNADEVTWDIRYRGQSFELPVTDLGTDPMRLRELFEALHEARYGHRDSGVPIELVTVRRRYFTAGPEMSLEGSDFSPRSGPESIDLGQATLFLPEGWSASNYRAGLIRMTRDQLV